MFMFDLKKVSTKRRLFLGFNYINLGIKTIYHKELVLSLPITLKESIFVSSKNKSQVLFVHQAPYWKGTYVYFSGVSATLFYSLVKQTLINCEFFSSAILGRFDLNYVRKNKTDANK